jgi:hypothetical protein
MEIQLVFVSKVRKILSLLRFQVLGSRFGQIKSAFLVMNIAAPLYGFYWPLVSQMCAVVTTNRYVNILFIGPIHYH